MKKLLIGIVALIMVACTSVETPHVTVDASLMKECDPIPIAVPRDGKQLTMGELLLSDIELAGMYKECAKGKSGLIEAVKELNNSNK